MSITRPTVPTTTCAPAFRRGLVADRRRRRRRRRRQCPPLAVGAQRLRHLDAELARRGQHERLDLRVAGSTYWSIGRPKAAVLPVPVWAWPISRGPRAARGSPAPGSAWAARSRGAVSASSSASERPRSAKVGIRRESSGREARRALGRGVEQQLAARPARLEVLVRAADLRKRVGRCPSTGFSSPRAARSKRSRERSAHHLRGRPMQCISQKPMTARLLRSSVPFETCSARGWRARRRRCRPNGASAPRRWSKTRPPAISKHDVDLLALVRLAERGPEVLVAGSTAASAPSSSASSRFSGVLAVAITRPAPSGLPSCTARLPTPPAAACTTTRLALLRASPRFGTGARRSAPGSRARAPRRRRPRPGSGRCRRAGAGAYSA